MEFDVAKSIRYLRMAQKTFSWLCWERSVGACPHCKQPHTGPWLVVSFGQSQLEALENGEMAIEAIKKGLGQQHESELLALPSAEIPRPNVYGL